LTVTTIERIRPGRAAHAWVIRTVEDLKGSDPFAPVTLIAPNYYAGRQARWALAGAGGYVNVRSMLLGDIATQIAGPAESIQPLTPVLEESAIRAAVRKVGGVLAPVAHHRALHQALLLLFRELRRLEIHIETPHSAMAAAALQAYAEFQRLIEPFNDRTRIRKRATDRLLNATIAPRELQELGGLILFLPTRLDKADARLLAALARWTPVRAAFTQFQATDELGNALPAQSQAQLESALFSESIQWNSVPPIVETHTSPAVSVIRAPDPAAEIREVVRSIARDLDGEAPIPLHRTALLYRQTDPYAVLVRDSLTLAGLPWSALEGRTLAESRPGHALLCLLELIQRDFSREAVLGWIDAAPTTQAGLPGSAWDRASRAANVVRKSEQWLERLDHYAARQRELAQQRADEGNAPATRALRREADLAEKMRVRMATLQQSLLAPVDGSSWLAFVTWAEGLWTDLCGGPRAWPVAEQPFATDVGRVLAELRQADLVEEEPGTSLSMFKTTLRDALEGCARPVGSLGSGVLVGPVPSVTGLAFERVYIVGMTESAFPTPPPADPFFPSAEEDPLESRERQRHAERLAFSTAVAAADGGRLTLSVPDSIGDRKTFPSPWLLELASQVSAIQPLFTTRFQTLQQCADNPWLRVVTSAINGIQTAPPLADLEDHRLREAAAAADHLQLQPIASRDDLPLGASLAASAARSTSAFTAFDGNVETLDVQRVLDAAKRISASGIETWATCPFQFFLGRVLRVNATDRPEDSWTVDPLERGTLVHRIVETFFKKLQPTGRLDGLADFSAAEHQLMEDIASECFADLERRGVTGHPLVWENTSATIRADLRTFLIKDERWRRDNRLQPRSFEQPFGMGTSASWAPLELDLSAIGVRFRGYIDRVDVDSTGRRGYLYDYKTGSATAYGDFTKDSVQAGKHIQLALYRQAVLAALPDVDEVGGAYWFISSRGDFKMLPIKSMPRGEDRQLLAVLEATTQGILAGAFPQVPGNETTRPGKFSWDNCVYCGFDRMCPAGRDAVWERKQNTPGHARHKRLVENDQA
jgi:ATP-dependent helicase/nuclease subunit B